MKRFLEILTEEPSAEEFLNCLLPRLIGDRPISFHIVAHHGKLDLLRKLPRKLHAYSKTWWQDQRIMVLLDRDNDDCLKLKATLEQFATEAGLRSKSVSAKDFQIINRIAIEELEAWFLGDEAAVRKAFRG